MKKFSLLLLISFFLAGMTAGFAPAAHAVTGTGNAALVLPSDGSQYTLDISSQFDAFTINPASFTFSLANGSVVKLSSSDKRLLDNSLNIPTTCGADSSTLIIQSAASQTVTITPGAVCAPASSGLHVDNQNPNCSDSGAGTQTQPFCTITKANAMANTGDILTIHAGTYREKIVITKSNITMQAFAGDKPMIKGSDVISGWTQEAGKNVWSKNIPIPEAQILDPTIGGFQVCLPAVPLCRFPYQVFVDSVNLKKVTPGTDPEPGQFTWSDTSQNPTMRIGTNPAGKVVEVSVRNQWITAAIPQGSNSPYDLPNNVTIRGLTFRHGVGGPGAIEPGPYRPPLCADQPNRADCAANTGTGWVIENNDIGWAHGKGINLFSSLHTIQNNIIHHNSNLGIAGNVQNATISSNTIHDNNIEGYNYDWEAGGLKITISKTTTISNNTVYNNTGIGLICDIVCDGITFANNRVYNNTQGIMYEISKNGTIKDNVVFDNGGQGIWISNAGTSTVTGNVAVRNLFAQIFLLQDDRGAGFPNTQDNVIQNNTLIGNDQNAAQQQNLKALHVGGPNVLGTNTIDFNKLFRYGSVPTLYHWISQSYNTPAAFCAAVAGKECSSTVLTRQQADQVLIDNNIPLTPLAMSQTLTPRESSGAPLQASSSKPPSTPLNYAALIGSAVSPSATRISTPTPVPLSSSPPLPRVLRKQGDIPIKPSSTAPPLPRVLRKQGDTQVKSSSAAPPSPPLPRVLRKQDDVQIKSPSAPSASSPPSVSRLPTLPSGRQPAVKFSIGDRVQTTDALRVRIAPSLRGALLGSQRRATQGTVIAAPVFSNRYTWWKIDFERGPDGWSAEDWLQKIATATLRTPPLRQIPLSPPAPTPARTPPPDPARVREPVPTPTPVRTPSQGLTPVQRPREIR